MSTYTLCAFDFEKDLKIYIIQLENSLQYTALCWFFRKFVESTEKNITIFISAF